MTYSESKVIEHALRCARQLMSDFMHELDRGAFEPPENVEAARARICGCGGRLGYIADVTLLIDDALKRLEAHDPR